ncbi:MAG: DUF4157 domain-containing protein [Alphaproteobacteria bacterium]
MTHIAVHARGAAARSASQTAPPSRARRSLSHGPANQALQTKLRVGRTDDPAEREADRIADQVVGGENAPPIGSAPPPPPAIRPKCAACAEEDDETIRRRADEAEEDEKLRMKQDAPCTACAGEAQAGATQAANALSGTGASLSPGLRAYFEPRFGRDFSGVRLHVDGHASAAAQAINARAYTLGHDIGFAPGQFAPETVEGRRLLAHELAHVAQQGAAVIRRDPEDEAETAEAADAAPVASEEPSFTPEERAEEIRWSQDSPGTIGASTDPFRITLENFAIDSASLKAEHVAALAEVRSLLRRAQAGHLRVAVVGHTDLTGTERHNRRLSHRRAWAAKARLGRVRGIQVVTTGLGEARPATSNATREGRAENRRVEIFFLPGPELRRPEPTPEPPTDDQPPDVDRPPDETEPPRPEEPESTEDGPPPAEDDDWFCLEHPIICAAIGGGAALFIFCLTNPQFCLPGGGPPTLPPPDGEPPEPEEPRKRACVASTSLPSGTIKARRVTMGLRHLLQAPFSMGLVFENDPEQGCDCSCGEYLQEVKGGFEEDTGSGWTAAQTPLAATGNRIHPTRFQEDADYPRAYGHRFDDPLRAVPTDPVDNDQFLPDQATGCTYSGRDSPGFNVVDPPPGSRYRFRLFFRGAAVDGCAGRIRIDDWHEWTVEGFMTIPSPPAPPPTPPTPPSPPPSSTPPPSGPSTTPAPYTGPSIGPAPSGPVVPAPSNPTLLCLSGQISCAAVDYLLDHLLGGLVLEDAAREHAINLELRALRHHCTLFLGPPPTPFTSEVEGRMRREQQLRRHAERRIENFLTWRTRVVDHPLPRCP